VEQVIQQIIATAPCNDINIADPPLEEIIREIYRADVVPDPAAPPINGEQSQDRTQKVHG
jgi:hypothetical protein